MITHSCLLCMHACVSMSPHYLLLPTAGGKMRAQMKSLCESAQCGNAVPPTLHNVPQDVVEPTDGDIHAEMVDNELNAAWRTRSRRINLHLAAWIVCAAKPRLEILKDAAIICRSKPSAAKLALSHQWLVGGLIVVFESPCGTVTVTL